MDSSLTERRSRSTSLVHWYFYRINGHLLRYLRRFPHQQLLLTAEKSRLCQYTEKEWEFASVFSLYGFNFSV